jgi:hypothetical protein
MKTLTKEDMGWRCLSCGDFHQRGDTVKKNCCKEYNPADVDLWVSVDSLYAILKSLIDEKGFVANHEDDKDCGNKTYATAYDVIEITDIKTAFELLFKEGDDGHIQH